MCIKKRISALCLCFVLSLGISACNGAENSTVNQNAFKEESAARSDRVDFNIGSQNIDVVVDESPADPPADGVDKEDSIEFNARYIRTDGYREGAEFPQVFFIDSTEELQTYYNTNKEAFQLEQSRPADGEMQDFLSLCNDYNDTFFEDHYLVFILLEEGSGSIRHKVSDVYMSNQTISSSEIDTSEPKLTVFIEPIIPETGTCDMAEWHIILELNRSEQEPTCADIYYADQLILGDKTSDKVTNTLPVREIPPELKIITPDARIESFTTTQGGYSWAFMKEDGTVSAVTTDAPHPLQANLLPVKLNYNEIKLAFEDTPDSIIIRTWSESTMGSTDITEESKVDIIPTEEIIVDTYPLITLKEGGCVYQITAIWDENTRPYFGEVNYCFYAIVESQS